jgi:hypothetical protein
LKFLIFGLSGSGKTTLACTFPKPLLLVRPEAVEDGSLSVRNVAGVRVTPPIVDPDQLTHVCEGQKRTNAYRSIVIDGLDDVQALTVKKHMGFQDTMVQSMWKVVKQADWLMVATIMKDILRSLLRLTENGVSVVLVCGERRLGDKTGDNQGDVSISVPKVMAALTPSITGWVHKVCDYNLHTFKQPGIERVNANIAGQDVIQEIPTGKVEYCAHLDDADCYYATKFRVPKGTVLPPVMSDPTYAKLAKLIRPS